MDGFSVFGAQLAHRLDDHVAVGRIDRNRHDERVEEYILVREAFGVEALHEEADVLDSFPRSFGHPSRARGARDDAGPGFRRDGYHCRAFERDRVDEGLSPGFIAEGEPCREDVRVGGVDARGTLA